MIRIDEIWLATEPLDMRAGPDKALARVIQVFGAARPHCAYLFANRRGNRMKVLIHDGFGIWLCARRLHRGKFHWGDAWRGDQLRLTDEQLAALVQGLPWQRLGADAVSRCCNHTLFPLAIRPTSNRPPGAGLAYCPP